MTNTTPTGATRLPARPAVRGALAPGEKRMGVPKPDEHGNDGLASSKTFHRRQPRVGRLRLDVIRMSLSERDRKILAGLVEHRFLSTLDVQRWHFAGHASPVTAARTCRRVLARLRELGTIQALERRLGGYGAGSSKQIWHLTPVGERLVTGTSTRRIREPSQAFLAHEMGVAAMHLSLLEAERAKRLRLLDFTTEPSCWRKFPGAGGQVVTLKPDFFTVIDALDGYETLVFGEYDRGTESPRTIAKKAGVYEAYWRTGIEERRSGAFPTVLWIVPDTERRDRIRQELGKAARISMALHQFALPEQFVDVMTGKEEQGA